MSLTRVRILALACALLVASCAHPGKRPDGLPVGSALSGREIETIAILGTNDIHGAIDAQALKSRESEGTTPIPYRAAGLPALASYIEELRSEFGPGFVWLDAGDQFQGSIDSNLAQGEPLTLFFNRLGLNAAAIGNHEFDYGASKAPGADPADRLGALKARMDEAHFPYLGANLRDGATGELATARLPKLEAHRIFNAGPVKVGVLGLSTLDTPKTTTPLNVRELAFADLARTTLREASELRKAGADVVVAVTHVGLKCESGRSTEDSFLRAPADPQGECNPHDELVRLLKVLPPGTLDAVVAGHSHQVVHHWVAGVPVIQGGAFGRYINVIYLNYDLRQHKMLADLTRIEGPIPVCPAVFSAQGDCNGERPAPKGGRGKLTAPVFHGADLAEDGAVRDLIAPFLERSAVAKREILGEAARPIDHERFRESELGDLATDAMRELTGADAALMNAGGVRAPWEQGPISYEEVFRTFPFDNQVIVLHVTGRELKLILRVADSGSRGFASTSGLRLRVIAPQANAPELDLNGDGRIDTWEMNRLLEAARADGSPIDDDANYRLATLDFLVNGGDDLAWVMTQIPAQHQDPPAGLLRDAVVQHLKKLAAAGPINSFEHPLVDPAGPRLMLVQPDAKSKGHHRGRRRRRG